MTVGRSSHRPRVGPQAEEPQRGSRTRTLLLPGAIGAAVGLVVGGFVGSILGGGADDPGVDADLRLACDYASSLTEDFDPDAVIDVDGPVHWQVLAVSGHAQAAAAADDTYAELRTHSGDLLTGTQSLDAALIEETLTAM